MNNYGNEMTHSTDSPDVCIINKNIVVTFRSLFSLKLIRLDSMKPIPDNSIRMTQLLALQSHSNALLRKII